VDQGEGEQLTGNTVGEYAIPNTTDLAVSERLALEDAPPGIDCTQLYTEK
jgi:hypothetical protein